MTKTNKFVAALDEAAEKMGLTRQELLSAAALDLFYMWKIRRAVKDGDTTRVVAYAVAALRSDLARYARRLR